ncbi:Uncharacterized protein APZ42_002638, partial [Daphnia magna]
DKRLSQAKLRRNLQEEIYKKFEEAVYATSEKKSEKIIRDCEAFLCGLDEDDEDGTYDGLGHYFKTHWFNITEYSAMFFRRDLLTLGNNTTNRIERYHSTLKKNLRNRKLRFPELIQVLLDISQLREFDRKKKGNEMKIRFPVQELNPVLERLCKVYTPYAVDRVVDQLAATTTSYNIIKDRNTYIVASHTGRYTAKTDLTECSCTFFQNFCLPSRHLLFLSEKEEIATMLANPWKKLIFQDFNIFFFKKPANLFL